MKDKRFFLFLALISISVLLHASKIKYPVSTIPKALLDNSKSVVRISNIVFEVDGNKRATLTVHHAITILNEDALDEAELYIPYDKFTRISDIQATIYNEYGNKVRKILPTEVIDYSGSSSYAGYKDDRIKIVELSYRTVPFTIEYSYQIHFNGLLYYPPWMPQDAYEQSVEHGKFTAIVPKGTELRYYEQNFPVTANIRSDGKKKVYSWQVSDLKPLKWEPYDPPLMEYVSCVYLAPSDFELDGYEGNAESWQNFGQWFNLLNTGRDELPQETVDFIHELVRDCTTEKEKVEKIYTWMQNNTRYVNVKLGIGGFQPFEAKVVDKLKYGDCKALSNYTKALLAAANIPSIYTLVRAGSNAAKIIPEFPSAQFNHAFLCVPLENDTLWLECTSQINPCGFLSDFTDDRDVLLITDEGGKLVHTPGYSAEEYLEVHTADVSLDAEGNGKAKILNTYTGQSYSDRVPVLMGDREDKKKLLYEMIDIPNFKILNFDHSEKKDLLPEIVEDLDLELEHYGTMMSNRMLVKLNLFNRLEPLPYDRDKRKSDIMIRRGFLEIDTIRFAIPKEFEVESLPENKELNSKFADYKSEVRLADSGIIYIRTFRVNKGTYDKTAYEDFFAYVEELSLADNLQAVLTRKE